MGISPEALLDELVKIGEAVEKEKSPMRRALGTAVLAGLGTGVGAAGASVLGQYLAKKPVTTATLNTVKIILPIMTGAAVVLGNELRKMKQEKYKKVPGWRGDNGNAD
jgi:hypothetical protein